MIAVQPVLEISAHDDFRLWPVAALEPYGFLPLNGALGPAEVGTAVMSIARCNDTDPADEDHPPRPADPLGAFLHPLLTMDNLFACGGLRITDTVTGATATPGCCCGLEERYDWTDVIDGVGSASFGHDPSPFAERRGDIVRLTVDTTTTGSPVIELSAADLPRLLATAEDDLTDFLALAARWAERQLPDHAGPVITALARALVLREPAVSPGR
jgi:hypothetical protein